MNVAEIRQEAVGTVYVNSQWQIVARWIRNMVKVEPKIMRQVSKASFGNLGSWLNNRTANINRACGCLVGTVALELVRDRNSVTLGKPVYDWGRAGSVQFYDTQDNTLPTPKVVTELAESFCSNMTVAAAKAGVAAARLGEELGQRGAVVLIKDEIVRQLAIRQRRIRAAKLAKRNKKGQWA